MDENQLAEEHSLVKDTIFRIKTYVLIGKRFVLNSFSSIKKHKDKSELINKPVIAFSESDLWNPFDNEKNWILTAGKIENLRIAARKLNGLEIKKNEVFSFWKHIGNPNFNKGYVIGREIREGCIVPTIAGGLCQVSNALYDAALKANFDIIERHKHSKVIKGSLAEKDRDATVKWNYVDLRFKSNFDFRIEVKLSADKLIVSYKSKQKNIKSEITNPKERSFSKLNDCYSCGNFSCFKHPDRTSVKQESATTTFILDEKWPEFDNYITPFVTSSDYFIVPLKKGLFIKTNRYSWSAMQSKNTKSTAFQGIYRALKLRYAPKNKNNSFELSLQLDKKIAIAAAKKIPIDSTHVVISQNLLPFIYETGALGGRTFDVVMTRLPFEKIHQKLDFAVSKHPESPTLNDFRASKELIKLENEALTKARKIITPHSEIAAIFKNKVEKLSWYIPTEKKQQQKGTKVLFPASSVARKGAYEIKKLTKELNLTLAVTGRTLENENFWEGVQIEKFNGDFNQIGLVLYPTYIEHQPRKILKAISKNIPVITTANCGINDAKNIKIIDLENYNELKNEVVKTLNISV